MNATNKYQASQSWALAAYTLMDRWVDGSIAQIARMAQCMKALSITVLTADKLSEITSDPRLSLARQFL